MFNVRGRLPSPELSTDALHRGGELFYHCVLERSFADRVSQH
jgi:hypothetical protein